MQNGWIRDVLNRNTPVGTRKVFGCFLFENIDAEISAPEEGRFIRLPRRGQGVA